MEDNTGGHFDRRLRMLRTSLSVLLSSLYILSFYHSLSPFLARVSGIWCKSDGFSLVQPLRPSQLKSRFLEKLTRNIKDRSKSILSSVKEIRILDVFTVTIKTEGEVYNMTRAHDSIDQ